MRRRIGISEARGKLPELAKHLARNPTDVVLIEHRDLRERIAMTSEENLRYLETMADELRKQAAGSFRLAGSITSQLTDDELEAALARLREDAARLSDQKLRD